MNEGHELKYSRKIFSTTLSYIGKFYLLNIHSRNFENYTGKEYVIWFKDKRTYFF